MVLLDTNSYTAYFKKDVRVKKEMDKCRRVFVSVISIGELLSGFKKGNREESNINDLDDFLSDRKAKLLPITFKTAACYATIKYSLVKKGTPIPSNDIWIAASAIQTKSTLVTFDKHFFKVPGLKLWKELKS